MGGGQDILPLGAGRPRKPEFEGYTKVEVVVGSGAAASIMPTATNDTRSSTADRRRPRDGSGASGEAQRPPRSEAAKTSSSSLRIVSARQIERESDATIPPAAAAPDADAHSEDPEDLHRLADRVVSERKDPDVQCDTWRRTAAALLTESDVSDGDDLTSVSSTDSDSTSLDSH